MRWLAFVLSLFRRRTRRDPKATFAFWDGTRDRVADPIRVWSRLNGEGFNVAVTLNVVQTDGPGGMDEATAERLANARLAAMVKLAERVGEVFGIPDLTDDGAGLTVAERVSLAAAYLAFMAARGAAARP